MKVKHVDHGIMDIEAEATAAPFLRALKASSPKLKLHATTNNGSRRFVVALEDLNLEHWALSALNATVKTGT